MPSDGWRWELHSQMNKPLRHMDSRSAARLANRSGPCSAATSCRMNARLSDGTYEGDGLDLLETLGFEGRSLGAPLIEKGHRTAVAGLIRRLKTWSARNERRQVQPKTGVRPFSGHPHIDGVPISQAQGIFLADGIQHGMMVSFTRLASSREGASLSTDLAARLACLISKSNRWASLAQNAGRT